MNSGEYLAIVAVGTNDIDMLKYLYKAGCPIGTDTRNKVDNTQEEIIEFLSRVGGN